jgi:ribosomal protein S18 acetylase RimI-like enzyme
VISISAGFEAEETASVAALYWQAFCDKLGRVMGPDAKGVAFVNRVLDPRFALVARDPAGTLLGVAGFKTFDGSLVAGELSDMWEIYGAFGGFWRGLLLGALERDTDNKRFLIDGIFVHADARGQGVGTLLLEAICHEAKTRGYPAVRLDVIDTNPRAKALYLRLGFKEVGEQLTGPLRYVFGFKSTTTMVREI